MNTTPLPKLPLTDGGIESFTVGDFVTFDRHLDEHLVNAYADVVLDHSPLHVDDEYAKGAAWGRRVVHGMLLTSHFSSVVGMLLPGKRALLVSTDFDYVQPVFVGETVTFSARVIQVDQARSLLRLSCLVLRTHEICSRGTALAEVR